MVPISPIKKTPGHGNIMMSSTKILENLSFKFHINYSKSLNKRLIFSQIAHILSDKLDTRQEQDESKKVRDNLILE